MNMYIRFFKLIVHAHFDAYLGIVVVVVVDVDGANDPHSPPPRFQEQGRLK